MAIAGKRQEIADALNTVDGIKAYTIMPTAPKPGDAWCQRGPSIRVNGINFEDTWYVIVFTSGSSAAIADAWRDENQDLLVAALENNSVGFVDEINPVDLSTAQVSRFGLQLIFRS